MHSRYARNFLFKCLSKWIDRIISNLKLFLFWDCISSQHTWSASKVMPGLQAIQISSVLRPYCSNINILCFCTSISVEIFETFLLFSEGDEITLHYAGKVLIYKSRGELSFQLILTKKYTLKQKICIFYAHKKQQNNLAKIAEIFSIAGQPKTSQNLKLYLTKIAYHPTVIQIEKYATEMVGDLKQV